MAHHKSAIKRIKTNLKAQERNRHYKSMLKSALKAVFTTTEKEAVIEKSKTAVSLLDKLAYKKIIHKNQAAHKKSKIARYVNSI